MSPHRACEACGGRAVQRLKTAICAACCLWFLEMNEVRAQEAARRANQDQTPRGRR